MAEMWLYAAGWVAVGRVAIRVDAIYAVIAASDGVVLLYGDGCESLVTGKPLQQIVHELDAIRCLRPGAAWAEDMIAQMPTAPKVELKRKHPGATQEADPDVDD